MIIPLFPVIFGLLALALGGCEKPVPATTIVPAPPVRPMLADECDTRRVPGPKWVDLPERDVTRDDVARLWRVNKTGFAALAGHRAVCSASLAARFPAPATVAAASPSTARRAQE